MSDSNSPAAPAGAYLDEVEIPMVRAVPERIVAAWAKNDGAAFAAVFTPDGTLVLPGGVFLCGREAIGAYMTRGFAGPYKGTGVRGTPVSMRAIAPGAVVLVTEGGVVGAGEDTPSPDSAVRATWVLVKQGSQWLITAYQNTPMAAA